MNANNPTRKKRVPNHRLKEEREKRGWTHKDVADLINLPDAHTVGRWERGVSFPLPHYRQKLCSIFGKSLEELGLLPIKYEEAPASVIALGKQQTEPFWKVPYTFTSFIGRDGDIATVCALLKRSDIRLVSLLGPGGVGKTRLAMQIATKLRDQFAAGICFISLAAIWTARRLFTWNRPDFTPTWMFDLVTASGLCNSLHLGRLAPSCFQLACPLFTCRLDRCGACTWWSGISPQRVQRS
jgi:transcriptional regulator with XRE-family HTH domain